MSKFVLIGYANSNHKFYWNETYGWVTNPHKATQFINSIESKNSINRAMESKRGKFKVNAVISCKMRFDDNTVYMRY